MDPLYYICLYIYPIPPTMICRSSSSAAPTTSHSEYRICEGVYNLITPVKTKAAGGGEAAGYWRSSDPKRPFSWVSSTYSGNQSIDKIKSTYFNRRDDISIIYS